MYAFGTEYQSVTDPFRDMFSEVQDRLLMQKPISVGEWQSQKIGTPMRELLNVVCSIMIPGSPRELARQTGAHLPWAEDHFQERVGGQPLNPAPSEAWWPFAAKKNNTTNADHKSEGEAFSHTYPERMWPKRANNQLYHEGIRFDYGDLNDVVEVLHKSPMTRQAYLPLWFPEDLTAVKLGKRVPCTLGYGFIMRHGVLHMSYFMRSTDLLRHFQDDIYMAGRLNQWVVEKLNDRLREQGDMPVISPGVLTFHTQNMHIFDADVDRINYLKEQGKVWAE
jgi:hypothetical protein